MGMVSIQAQTILPTMVHFTAWKGLLVPTPTMDAEITKITEGSPREGRQ